MISILVANAKGGCGKTTIATNLAAAFAAGGRRTVLADTDRQRSSLHWAERRPRNVAPVIALDWAREAGALPDVVERLVIDAPAGLRKGEAEALIALADLVVLPVLPSAFDEGATAAFLTKLEALKPIRKSKKSVAVVANRIRPGTRTAARLELFLRDIGHNVVARLRDTQLYPEAALYGLGLYDLPGKRVAEYRADWEPLLGFLEEGTL